MVFQKAGPYKLQVNKDDFLKAHPLLFPAYYVIRLSELSDSDEAVR